MMSSLESDFTANPWPFVQLCALTPTLDLVLDISSTYLTTIGAVHQRRTHVLYRTIDRGAIPGPQQTFNIAEEPHRKYRFE